jgi:nanoRNase/pAp phosphatase (c-di-AMP/oligoRNAs hydrolase)
MEFEAWNKINVSDLISDGVLLLDQENKLVKRLIKNAYMTNIAGYTVPVVNTSLLMSEVGNKLLEEYPGASFAACYTENGTHTQYSLRSRGDFDVSAVAKQFGGGGHAAASGYKVPISRVSMNNVTVTVK